MSDVSLENSERKTQETAGKVFELLDKISKKPRTIVRDDQADFGVFLDAFRSADSMGRRFGLIDTGRFDVLQMEWMVKAGIDLYTADEARSNVEDLRIILNACELGGSRVAFFQHGELTAKTTPGSITVPELETLARRGVCLHVSNRIRKRSGDDLVSLAGHCRQGGGWLVYYHHGALDPFLVNAAAAKSWIHVSGASISSEADVALLIQAATAGRKGRIVLTLEDWISPEWIRALDRAGIFFLMMTPPADFRSDWRKLEKRIRAKRLNPKAYYITTAFMP